MNRVASAALASAFFAATGGIAFAANAPAGAASNSPANAPAAAAKPAASAGTTTQANQGGENGASEARMTHALNLLEARGYGNFHDFRQDGKNFDATVVRAGKQMIVKIDPDSEQVTVQG